MKRIFTSILLSAFIAASVAQLPEGEIAITASSTLPSSKTSDFNPENIYDGSISSWCEGVEGDGIGEFIQVDFRYPDILDYIMIKNGFGKEKYWAANGRIQKLKVTNEEGETRVLVLDDTPDLQVIGLNVIDENEDHLMEASGGLPGASFTFEILDVYPGERWQDVCLCELNFNQWYTEKFAMTEEYIYKNLYKIFFKGLFDQSGALYVESDWDGYVEATMNNGYVYNEITSGDGTTGFDEYQVFINGLTDQYYIFHSALISYFTEAGMEGKLGDDEKPERVKKSSWEFFVFDPEIEDFKLVDDEDLGELFMILPTSHFTDDEGNILSNKDISISCIAPSEIAVSYPPFSENQVFYTWDGNWFRVN